VILLAALGFIVFQVLNGGEDEVPQSEVPTITGLTEEAAQAAVAALPETPFTLAACESEANDTVPAGQIISQDPAATTLADEGTQITCVVSAGVAETTVPQLVGLTQEQAEAQLTQDGLRLGDVDTEDGTTTAGEVLASTPEQGAAIESGGEVDIVVASGQNAVPNLLDPPISQTDAETAIRAAGLAVGEITPEENADVEPGTVLGQDPAGSVVVDLGTPVNLTVAVAPEVEMVGKIGHDEEFCGSNRRPARR